MRTSVFWSFVRHCKTAASATAKPRKAPRKKLVIDEDAPAVKPPFDWGSTALLIVPFATAWLGTWQVRRRRWKIDLIEHLNSRLSAPVIELPDELSTLNDLEYQKVHLKGVFDHNCELHLHSRTLIESANNPPGAKGGQVHRAGVHIITPLKVTGRNLVILVNRGWVPYSRLSPTTRAAGQVQGEVEFTGVVRLHENRPAFGGKNDPKKNQWLHRDLDAMSEEALTDRVIVDAVETIPGGPIGSQTRVSMRNEHWQYIITWYGISLFTGVGWYQRFVKFR